MFSWWNRIVKRCASSREDLPAAPPGSPLALPLIYSLIHLCCCHMASLSFPPPPPSLLLPSSPLPPSCLFSPSHISELLISGASQSGNARPFCTPSHPLFLCHSSSLHFAFLPLFSVAATGAPLPPLPMLQFTPKVRTDPILPPSAIDISSSKPLGSCVMQTRLVVWAWGEGRGEGHTLLFINQESTLLFIFMVS